MSFKGAGQSSIIVAGVTIISLSFALMIGENSIRIDGYPLTFSCAIIAFGLNWLAFIPSAAAQKDTYYDMVGSLTYLSLLVFAVFLSWPSDLRSMAVAVMVAVWAVRLGSFLFRRIHAAGGADQRFEKIKVNPPRFLVAWTLQAAWVTFTASAAIVVITSADKAPIDFFFYTGSLLWLLGFSFEVVSDEQKRRFKADPRNKDKFIKTGLWAWSRHPNYFGEISLWTGILIIAVPQLNSWSWLVLMSPVFVYLLLTRVSGINLLEAIAKDRWGENPEYQDYCKKTPVLLPRFPKD